MKLATSQELPMNNRPRFAFTHGQKAILWIGAFLCLWQLMQVPAVVDVMLDFYAAGIVPGTNIVLSPDAVLRLFFAVIFSVALYLFYRKFGRRPRSQRQPQTYDATAMVDLLSVAYRRHVRPPTAKAHIVDRVQAMGGRLAATAPVRAIARTAGGVVRGADRIFTGIGRVTEWLVIQAIVVVAWSVVWIGQLTGIALKFMWRHIEPSIRECDRWLERKVHQYQIGVIMVHGIRYVVQVVQSFRRTAITEDDSDHDRTRR
jgi:membrane protein implicated in regulation of membrane protease activity